MAKKPKKETTKRKQKKMRPIDSPTKAFGNVARGIMFIIIALFFVGLFFWIVFVLPSYIPDFPSFNETFPIP